MQDVAAEKTHFFEGEGHQQTSTFSIATSAKIFKMFIDGIYSNKIEAVVRELSTNAFDSHLMAGNPERPFKIVVPSRFDTTFAVRDYGVSMTHEQIMGIYTEVGTSTKEDTNSQVGKFGLGSKTPFAYTDTFSVVAVQEGVKRIYNAFIGSDGKRRMSLFHSEPSDDDTGLEVSFPAKVADVKAFENAVMRVAFGFDVKPTCRLEFPSIAESIVIQGSDYTVLGVMSPLNSYGISGPMIRQGCVLYPLDLNNGVLLSLSFGEREFFKRSNILIDMPIGTVDITPSRESLSYDEVTVNNLKTALTRIHDAVFVDMQKEIANCASMFEAMEKFLHFRVNLSGANSSSKFAPKWRGREVPLQMELRGGFLRAESKRANNYGFKTLKFSYRNHYLKASVEPESRYTHDTNINKNTIFFYYPGAVAPKFLTQRLNIAMIKNPNRAQTSIYDRYLVLTNFSLDTYAAKRMFVSCGRPDNFREMFINVADVEYEHIKPKKNLAVKLSRVDWHKKTWYPAPETIETAPFNAYYFLKKGASVIHGDSVYDAYDFRALMKGISKHGYDNDWAVYGINISRPDIIAKIPSGWVNVLEDIERRRDALTPEEIAAAIRAKRAGSYNKKTRSQQNFHSIIQWIQHWPASDEEKRASCECYEMFTDCSVVSYSPPKNGVANLMDLISHIGMDSDKYLVNCEKAKTINAGFVETNYKLFARLDIMYPALAQLHFADSLNDRDSPLGAMCLSYMKQRDAKSQQEDQNDLAWSLIP